MYNLRVEGVRDLARYTTLLDQRKVSHDPLSGIVDGSNKTFHTQYYPLLASGSITGYVSGSAAVISSVDYDTGTVTMAGAPAAQPEADYTFTPFTTSQVASMLMAGFDEMQSRWVRSDFVLSSGSTTYVQPTDDDAGIYLASRNTDTNVLTDPQCSGSVPFSELRTQIRFYMACCEYAYQSRQLLGSALTSVSFRERAGAQLDRSRIPGNIKLALDTMEANVVRSMRAAWDEFYKDGEQYGEAIAPQHSLGYEVMFDWHDNTYPSSDSEWTLL